MALSDVNVIAAYTHSLGRCECTRPHREADAPHSGDRCRKTFLGREYWRPIYVEDEAGPEGIEIVCITCYRLAQAEAGAAVGAGAS